MIQFTTNSEPMRKRRRVDPIIEQNRQKRKLKKIEKEIKRLSRMDRTLVPVEEIEGDRQLMKDIATRRRQPIDVSEIEMDKRILLMKEWSAYQWKVLKVEMQNYHTALKAQKKALDYLHTTRPDLYQCAIHACPSTTMNDDEVEVSDYILPIILTGPYSTAPLQFSDKFSGIPQYDPPDGEIADITTKISYEFQLDKMFIVDPKGGGQKFQKKS